jgi:hypothetical protein
MLTEVIAQFEGLAEFTLKRASMTRSLEIQSLNALHSTERG